MLICLLIYSVFLCCCSLTQSCLTLCNPVELQHARLPCPSLSPWVCSNSCPLGWWCHPTISLSVAPFSSCPQSFTASGSFPTSRLFASSGQSIEASASASVLSVNNQSWFPLDWLVWPCCPRHSQESPQHHSLKASVLQSSVFFMVQLSHSDITTGKTIALARRTFVGKVMSSFFKYAV